MRQAFIWDILTHIPEDFRLLFRHRISLPTLVYFFSRILSLAYVTTSTIFQTSKVGSCQALQVALGWCFCLAVSSTSFLFFLRIRAIFERKPVVVAFFFVMWLAVLGGTMTVPFAIRGDHIGDTKYCINTLVKPFSSAGIIVSSVNDALVLIAVSWRIVTTVTLEDTVQGRIKSFFGKGQLPGLSKAILQSGQQYYAMTVSLNVVTLVMILVPSLPPVYHAMLTVPNVALMNSMACRVYRNIKFGTMLAVPTTFRSTTVNQSLTLPDTLNSTRQERFYHFNERGGVEVSKTIEELRDNVALNVILPPPKSTGNDSVHSTERDGSVV
ncbi:hypothetical protein AX17_003790 [Amanita inopinata Kibby_2008]|nr:hypothetical protein AX17_003790 [Amanita inopinata Kibby_2008]